MLPLATMISQVTRLPAVFVRKEAKTYGTCRLAEGSEIDEADTALRALVTGLAESIPNGGDLLKHVAAAQDTPAALANVIAASLVADTMTRQHLLETTDVFARLEQLSSEVVALIDRVGKPGRAN